MFDTHCHLNFSRFKKNIDEVINNAQAAGVTHITIPGTDIKSSKVAIEIAEKYENIYAAVGIHPHHVYEVPNDNLQVTKLVKELEQLIFNVKVVAIGEIGLDKHVYTNTKYEAYNVTSEFLAQQKILFIEQLKLASMYNKSIILHNREAVDDILELLTNNWDKKFEGRTVFHCCEPNKTILEFAKEHKIFLGVDGDITYEKEKQEFIKQIPLDMLVVETDSPFLLPEPMRGRKEFPNTPANIPFIISFIANILGKQTEELQKISTDNAKRLFALN
jgi:TatD DNase family protein